MSKKRNNKESLICLIPKLSQTFFVDRIQSKEKFFFFFTKEELLKERGNGGLNKNEKKAY